MQIKTNGVEWMAYTGQCHLYVLLRALHRRKWSQKHVRSVYNTYRKLHSANRMVPSAGAYDSRNGYRNQRLACRAISASAKLRATFRSNDIFVVVWCFSAVSYKLAVNRFDKSADSKRSTNHKFDQILEFHFHRSGPNFRCESVPMLHSSVPNFWMIGILSSFALRKIAVLTTFLVPGGKITQSH